MPLEGLARRERIARQMEDALREACMRESGFEPRMSVDWNRGHVEITAELACGSGTLAVFSVVVAEAA